MAVALVFGFGAGTFACVGDPVIGVPPSDGGVDASQGKCDEYCSEIRTTCTGDNLQYRNDAECKRFCALLAPGSADDRTQNTVSCRLANAKLGQTKAICANAGPWGGDVCGTRCNTFCEINAATCGTLGAAAPYVDRADCLERACRVLTFDEALGDGVSADRFDGEDTLNCRMFHLGLALDDALAGHCPHTALTSPTCKVRDAGTD